MSAPDPHAEPLSQVEPLSPAHDVSTFDCGAHDSLNVWLKRFAWTNQQSETSRTYVVHRGRRVVAYYSIATGSVRRDEAPSRIAKGITNHPVPVVVVTRLAVDKSEQGMGLGKTLLKDALARIAAAAEIVGVRAVLVHAIDANAGKFYRHFGFEPSPSSDLHLMLLMKELRKGLQP